VNFDSNASRRKRMERFIKESNVEGNPLEKEYLRNPDLNNIRSEKVLKEALKLVTQVINIRFGISNSAEMV
jgi:hypothetical protein